MQKYVRNMQEYLVPSMQEYAQKRRKEIGKYVYNKLKYARICKTKMCTYMQKYHTHKYA